MRGLNSKVLQISSKRQRRSPTCSQNEWFPAGPMPNSTSKALHMPQKCSVSFRNCCKGHRKTEGFQWNIFWSLPWGAWLVPRTEQVRCFRRLSFCSTSYFKNWGWFHHDLMMMMMIVLEEDTLDIFVLFQMQKTRHPATLRQEELGNTQKQVFGTWWIEHCLDHQEMEVSWNRATPKPSMLMVFSIYTPSIVMGVPPWLWNPP